MGLKTVLTAMAAGIVPLLAACEDGPAVVSNFVKNDKILESSLTYAGAKGPVLAEIHGNPFAVSPGLLSETVYREMSASIGGRKFAYTGDPSAAPAPDLRIILLFGAANTVSGDRLCEGPLPTPAVSPDKLTVRAVVCQRGDLLSDAEGWARKVTGPDDPRFKRLIFDLTRALLQMN